MGQSLMEHHTDEEIKKEAEFWENFDIEAMKYGLPYWVDYRNGEYLHTPKKYLWSDPEIDRILYGDVKDLLINSVPKGSRVLDIGCGAGWLSLELARQGHDVVGIDIAEKRIEIAMETAKNNDQKIDYKVCSIEDLNVNDKFDVIVSFGTIHHFPNIEEELKRIETLLKEDGMFLMVENCSNITRNIADWFRKNVLRRPESTRSPFEDAASHRVVAEVKKMFDVRKQKYSLAFTKVAAEAIDLLPVKFPRAFHHLLLRGIKVVDDIVSSLRLINGETVYMLCYKRKRSIP